MSISILKHAQKYAAVPCFGKAPGQAPERKTAAVIHLIVNSLCHRNQHQKCKYSHQANDDTRNHFVKYHAQAHANAQQQRPPAHRPVPIRRSLHSA